MSSTCCQQAFWHWPPGLGPMASASLPLLLGISTSRPRLPSLGILALAYSCPRTSGFRFLALKFLASAKFPNTWLSVLPRHTNKEMFYKTFLKVWWHDATLFVYFSYLFTMYIHSLITFIQHIFPSPFAEVSLHIFIALKLSGKASLWCRAENRTRACLTASRRSTN